MISGCGHVTPTRQREQFICPACGLRLQVDVNAARIIARLAGDLARG